MYLGFSISKMLLIIYKALKGFLPCKQYDVGAVGDDGFILVDASVPF